MKKVLLSLLVTFTMISLVGCDKSEGGNDDETGIPTPKTIIVKKITLDDTNNLPYGYGTWIKPVNGIYCEAENMTRTDSKYLYSNLSDTQASLVVDGYQRLTTNTYHYKWEFTLTFTSPTAGTFRGTYAKLSNGFVASISGKFTITSE